MTILTNLHYCLLRQSNLFYFKSVHNTLSLSKCRSMSTKSIYSKTKDLALVHLADRTSQAVKIPYQILPPRPRNVKACAPEGLSNKHNDDGLILANSLAEHAENDKDFDSKYPTTRSTIRTRSTTIIEQPIDDDISEKYKRLLHDYENMLIDRQSCVDQLKLQTQVNEELKKLLIATMGDDLQIKLECLTNDKVRLGEDIKRYTSELNDEKEHLEKKSIQADVWRSKFLASSILVDELVSWRYFLIRQFQGAQNVLKSLLIEQGSIRSKLFAVFSFLNEARDVLDIKDAGKYARINQYHDISNLTDALVDIGQELNAKLLNTVSVKQQKRFYHQKSKEPLIGLTDAQKQAIRIVDIDSDEFYKNSCNNSLDTLCKEKRLKFLSHGHPSQCKFRNLTVNCCKKCAGEIKVV